MAEQDEIAESNFDVVAEFDLDEGQAAFFDEIRVDLDEIVVDRIEDLEPGTYRLVKEPFDE